MQPGKKRDLAIEPDGRQGLQSQECIAAARAGECGACTREHRGATSVSVENGKGTMVADLRQADSPIWLIFLLAAGTMSSATGQDTCRTAAIFPRPAL